MTLDALLNYIVQNPDIHAKWLNTLSYLENCGARKIARCEHPTLVKEEMLKHASEEFRHAHHLKKQIVKISDKALPDYSLSYLLGGYASKYYLERLDLWTCRYLKEKDKDPCFIRQACYLLVTYAIECRAEKFYPAYHDVLKRTGTRVSVKSIILEEKEHLGEMQKGIALLKNGVVHAKKVLTFEKYLYQQWLLTLSAEIKIVLKSKLFSVNSIFT